MPRKPTSLVEPSKPGRRRGRKRSRDDQPVETQAHLIDEEEIPGAADEAETLNPGEPEESELEPAPLESAEPSEPAEAADSGALVPFDPLARYLSEIRRFPLLSREEEIEIAKRYQKN